MKKISMKLVGAAVAAVVVGGAFAHAAEAEAVYSGSSFETVWGQVASDPYASLPHDKVTFASFFGFLEDKLLAASRRTLNDRSDLLPRFQKLVHPNGTCLAGTWNITEETPYTGYFKKGSRGLFIGRASAALSETDRGEYRAFGFAGKIFPTTDPTEVVPTANFFTIEDLGGTLTPHFLDAANTNDILKISITPTAFMSTPIAAAVVKAFSRADETLDLTQPFVRQLYPIAELGEADPSKSVSPRWLEIIGDDSTPRNDAVDLRDELAMGNYPNGIKLLIRTADVGARLAPLERQWSTIGYIELTQGATSDSCDHRLHFSHPKFRR
jgi:hypothetical protein